MKHRHVKWRIIFKMAGLLILLILAYIGLTAVRIWQFGQIDERTQADAIMVLGAAAWHDTPSPVFAERIRHGIWLYENGYADFLIFTGGYGTGAEYSEAHVARDYALAAGVPETSILIEEYSRTTIDHFSYAMYLIEEYQIDEVILVSDPFHMRRAVKMASDAGLIAYSSPTPTSRYRTLRTQLPFLRQEVTHYIYYRITSIFR